MGRGISLQDCRTQGVGFGLPAKRRQGCRSTHAGEVGCRIVGGNTLKSRECQVGLSRAQLQMAKAQRIDWMARKSRQGAQRGDGL